MLLTVLRKYGESATTGRMMINGGYFCRTLELPRNECIPEGEYPIFLTFSPKFNRIMPRLMAVIGHEGILIHKGNYIRDTSGCILVGYDEGKDGLGYPAVYRSTACFNELFNWLQEANKGQVISIELKEEK